MEQKTLLITGFEPFQQGTINPSWEAVALLPETIGPWRLEKLRLPEGFSPLYAVAIGYPDEEPAARPREKKETWL